MYLDERDQLVVFILLNAVTINLLDYTDNTLLNILLFVTNAVIVLFKFNRNISSVRKYKWLISLIFIIPFVNIDFDNKEKKDSYKLSAANKEFSVSSKYENFYKYEGSNIYSQFTLTKSNDYLNTEKGTKVFLKNDKIINFQNNIIYKLNFVTSDLKEINGSYYINKYSIIEKNNLKFVFFRNISPHQDFFSKDYNCFGWSIVTGDSSKLSEFQKECFKRTGTAHLFAVSGLHMGFVFLISKIIFVIIRDKYLSSSLSVLMCFCYGIFVGFPDSTIRAFLMILGYEISVISRIKTKKIYIFCLILAIVLLFNRSLLSISFQLSFTVVIFILYVIRDKNHENNKLCFSQKVIIYFLVCISASCGSFFIILDKFGYVSIFSSLLNFIINPLILVTFIMSAINILFFWIFESKYIFYFIDILYSILFKVIKLFYELEVSFSSERILFCFPDILHLLVFFLTLWFYFLPSLKRFRRLFIIIYFTLTFLISMWLNFFDFYKS